MKASIVLFSVSEVLPDNDRTVIVFFDNGISTWGSYMEVFKVEKNRDTGFYQKTDKREFQWGQDSEYWSKFDDTVLYWAEFPEIEINKFCSH